MNNSKCVRLIGSEMFLVGSHMFFLRMEMALLGNYMLLPGNNMIHPEVFSTVGKLSQISMLCGQTELLIKERCFNKTRSGYVNSLFFVSCLAQAATRTQSFAIEERKPRPKGLRDVKRGKRSMKKQAETFYQGYETSRPHATFMRHLTKHTGFVACQNGLFYLFVFENGRHKRRCFKNKGEQITFVFDEAGIYMQTLKASQLGVGTSVFCKNGAKTLSATRRIFYMQNLQIKKNQRQMKKRRTVG